MSTVLGGCDCGNLSVEMELSEPFDSYRPRACDCSFCRKHAAAYVSDPKGSLLIKVRQTELLGRYRQGSGTAECLLCARCGVLIGVSYQEGELCYAAVNVHAIGDGMTFGSPTVVSPKALAVDERVRRWKQIWFSNVRLELLRNGAQ
jgi:hypothetical protein